MIAAVDCDVPHAKEGWHCDLVTGHAGLHESHNLNGKKLAEWSEEDTPNAELTDPEGATAESGFW